MTTLRIQSLYGTPIPAGQKSSGTGKVQEFRNLLWESLSKGPENGINVSSHAERRLKERNISMDDTTRDLLISALNDLKARGGRDSLVVTRDAAFVVNVPTRTLVTAMDLSEAKSRIITQIDSVSLQNI